MNDEQTVDWTQDAEFMAFVNKAIPRAYARYKDPKNRAKGAPPDDFKECMKLLLAEVLELDMAEKKTERLHESGDVTLCALYVAATI